MGERSSFESEGYWESKKLGGKSLIFEITSVGRKLPGDVAKAFQFRLKTKSWQWPQFTFCEWFPAILNDTSQREGNDLKMSSWQLGCMERKKKGAKRESGWGMCWWIHSPNIYWDRCLGVGLAIKGVIIKSRHSLCPVGALGYWVLKSSEDREGHTLNSLFL